MPPQVFYIIYDGLLDPLGGRQILPYVQGIAVHPRPVCVLSFEKADRFSRGEQDIRVLIRVRKLWEKADGRVVRMSSSLRL